MSKRQTWNWILAASCKSLVADNGREKGITLLMCNPLQKLPSFSSSDFPFIAASLCFPLRLTTQAAGQRLQSHPQWRVQHVHSHVLKTCWYKPQAVRDPAFLRVPPYLLALHGAWLQPTGGQIKIPFPSVTLLLPHSTGFCCSQTQSAHLAPNQTIPKIDKQLWVRMDVQMGRERQIVWER